MHGLSKVGLVNLVDIETNNQARRNINTMTYLLQVTALEMGIYLSMSWKVMFK